MSSNSNHEADSAKPAKHDGATSHSHDSIGARVGEGISGAMKLIHGIGESVRGLAIDIADLGHGSGKTIAADGKAEAKEGVKLVED
ncbi:hypothetical protein BGY98DRAFT_976754, partial [Russula aff. rugulosa BPL654]